MKVFFGIQARSNSSRLSNKIYQKIGDKAVLDWVYDSVKGSAEFLEKELKISTSVKILGHESDQTLRAYCKEKQYSSAFPAVSENDLFARFNHAFKEDFTHLCRITADCWLVDPLLTASCIDLMLKQNLDYVSNTVFRTFEEGKDVQACSRKGFMWMFSHLKDREHPFYEFDVNKTVRDEFEKEGLRYANFTNPRFHFLLKGSSIDTQEDLDLAREMYEKEFKNHQRVG